MRRASLALLLAGCSVVNDPGSLQSEPEPLEHVCGDVAMLMCDAKARCCNDGGMIPNCIATAQAACALVLSAIDQPVVGYDPVVAGQVLAHGRLLASTCSPDFSRWFNVEIPSALRGTIPLGAPCGSQGYSVYACLDDKACIDQRALGSDYVCSERLPVGGMPCRDGRDCAHGTFCTTGDLIHHCEPQRPNLGPCTGDTQCTSYTCRGGLCVDPTVQNVYCSN